MAELTYKQLVRQVNARERQVTANAEAVRNAAELIKQHADDTATDADALGAKSVDRDSISDCQQLARIIRGVSDAAIRYASRAVDTAKAARAAREQAAATHAGFQEAFDRSTVTDLEKVSRDWFEQQ